ncbi:hypothetical protein QZH41_009286 [Actinostola sp. cb2023]|nr:hypothetical protein QZH41_009286 [Actinostola sp. cb2023]
MAAVKKEYQKKYGRSLEQDVKSETSGDFENLLTALMKGNRAGPSEVNEESARNDASALHEAGVKTWGTDEDKFIQILTTRSNAHLKAMMVEYEKLAGVQLQDSIKDEMDGDLRDGLVMLLSCAQDENKAHADKLYTALQDGDTSTVAKIIAGAEQTNMKAIEASYNSFYDPKLYFEVDKKCSEDLKKIILDRLKDKSERKKKSSQAGEPPKKISRNSGSVKQESVDKPTDKKKQPAEKDTNNNNSTPDDKQPAQEDQRNDQQLGTDNGGKEERPKMDIQKVEYHGTVIAAQSFDASKEVEKLNKAMKGFGSDEGAIIDVLGSYSSAQRQEIVTSYKQQYDKDLVDELKSELSGKFEDTIISLLSSAAENDANSLNASMKGLGTEEGVLIEIICSRSSKEIQDVKEAYKTSYEKDLAEVIKDETSGDLCDLLTGLLQGERLTTESYDEDAAYDDAERLLEAGEKRWGTDESMFINILTTRSPMQLQAIFQAYHHVSKKDILESIDEELEGDFHKAVKTLVVCVRNPPEYFAESLHEALTGIVTSSTTVTRIVITRSEIDLVEIKATFQDKYGKTLANEVKDSLKGDQETVLLKLIGE